MKHVNEIIAFTKPVVIPYALVESIRLPFELFKIYVGSDPAKKSSGAGKRLARARPPDRVKENRSVSQRFPPVISGGCPAAIRPKRTTGLAQSARRTATESRTESGWPKTAMMSTRGLAK